MGSSDQGVQKDRYMMIPRTLSFITRDDTVLLLKGAPNKKIWANLFNGVGGHVEKGENILSSAKREIFEETGYHIDDLNLTGVVSIDTGYVPGIMVYVFIGKYSGKNEPTPSHEGELLWVRYSDLDMIPLVEDLPVILPIVLNPSRGKEIFFAQYRYNAEDQLVISLANSTP